MADGARWFQKDNAPVHTSAVMTIWMADRQIQVIQHLPCSPDRALADLFLFPRVKREMVGLPSPRDLQGAVPNVVRTLD
jgi:hypothetical protein